MAMKTHELFPIKFFEFRNNEIDNEALKVRLESYVDILKKTNCISALRDLHTGNELKDIFSWFDQCLEEIRTTEKYDCDKFSITSSWFNRYMPNANMFLQHHRHSMSFFSGVYYLTPGSPTVFEDPVFQRSHPQLEVLQFNFKPETVFYPEPGKLIIFPSWVFHRSVPHTDPYDRYIISFNSFPAGKINYGIATDSTANISILNPYENK